MAISQTSTTYFEEETPLLTVYSNGAEIAAGKAVVVESSSAVTPYVDIISATTQAVLGVTVQTIANAGTGSVLRKGIIDMEAGTAGCTAGAYVSADANGDAVDAGADTQCIGIALTTATDGNEVRVALNCPSFRYESA